MTMLMIAAAAVVLWAIAEAVVRVRRRRFTRHVNQALDLVRVDELEQRRRAALIKALGGPA
jgi:hypothetical protein